MGKIMKRVCFSACGAALAILSACSSSLPRLPDLPAVPIPGLVSGPVAGDPACGGAWHLENGGGLAVTPAEEGLRWRALDGQTGRFVLEDEQWQAYGGWTDQPETRHIEFTCAGGLTAFESTLASPVAVMVQDTTFTAAKDTQLAGRLILPAGDTPVAVVLQVQGAEESSALLMDPFQHLMPMQGVGVFIYDKRGTGLSKGSYTQDFDLLAADAVAAAAEARRLAGPRLGRFGVHGAGQGGWIAPMAAPVIKPDFLMVSSGLLESPLAENRAQTVMDVAEAGYGPDAQMAAGLLADAAGVLMTSGFKRGYSELEALKKIYRGEPWYSHVKGDFTGDLLKYPDYVLRVAGPVRDTGTSWDHEGEPFLRQIRVPVLWVLASADREAPPAYTRSRLKTMQYEGYPLTVAEFASADHGMRGFEQMPDRSRQFTHYTPGYFRLLADFASGADILPEAYRDAAVTFGR